MAEPFQTLNQMVRKPFDLTLLEVIGTQVDEDRDTCCTSALSRRRIG